MGTKQDIRAYLYELKIRLMKEMPRVRKEIRVYEEGLVKNRLK